MAIRSRILIGLLTFFSIGASSAPISSETLNPSAPKAISDLRDSIVKGLGFQGDGLKVSGFDVRDALVGQSVAYEFDIEVDNKKFPIKLLEDVSRWDFVDLPIFRAGDEEERGLAKKGVVLPVLSPFQLSGPMELWIQDGDDLRLALPHDVDAGTLKKVILSDGAVVTVKGARSVSLRHPLDLPLPLNRTSHNGRPIASALIAIAESLRHGSRNTEKPLLSVRIVGPTSLTSSPSASSNSNSKLKLKRLGPGLVELSSPIMALAETTESPQPLRLWPLMSLNGSDPNLRGFEELLASVLGKKGREDGSFKLVRAEVSARTYVKMSFELEQKLPEDRDWSGFPGWKTRPERARTHYEVIARVEDDGKVVPERIAQIQPFTASDSVQPSEQTGNATMSQLPIVHPPPDYFML